MYIRRTTNKKIAQYAKDLRTNETEEEKKLWYRFLKEQKGHFRRQRAIGAYIADFYSYELKLVIELDGAQHYEQQEEYDRKRNEYMRSLGLTVLRYSNHDIKYNFQNICADIWNYIQQKE
ncbi:MAG: endonuclease domain-containing protein [Clostridia bacterium]|nr:endonuclease domain-containing protein [Clostridia bacterium]